MVMTATVIDNTDFEQTGKIEVLVDDFMMMDFDTHNLANDPSIITEMMGTKTSSDGSYKVDKRNVTSVYVATPIGGGIDYGFFHLPQINERGLITNLNDPKRTNAPKYIWIGSICEPQGSYGVDIGIPSEEAEGSYGVMGGIYQDSNANGKVIFKQKRTSYDSYAEPENSLEKFDWSMRPTENEVVMDIDKLSMKHHAYDEEDNEVGNSEFSMKDKGATFSYNTDEYGTINIDIDDMGNFSLSSVRKDEDNGDLNISITTDGRGMSVSVNRGRTTSGMIITPTEATVTSGNCSIQMDGKNITIGADASKDGIVEIKGKNIIIGSGSISTGKDKTAGLSRLVVAKGAEGGATVEETVASENVFIS